MSVDCPRALVVGENRRSVSQHSASLGYDGLMPGSIDTYLVWLIAGFVLVIAELLTGTFYLLVLGLAAIVGGVVARFGGNFLMQVMGASLVAVAGVMWVRMHFKAANTKSMPSLDAGQAVMLETWTNRAAGHARVRYRDTLWDAVVQGGPGESARGDAGNMYYIISIDGNTLHVGRDKPASA